MLTETPLPNKILITANFLVQKQTQRKVQLRRTKNG